MHLQEKTDAPLPERLAEHADAIEKLRRSEPVLDEILDNYALLTEAIRYWTGKSTERVEEFRGMVKELEREVIEFVRPRPGVSGSKFDSLDGFNSSSTCD